MNPYEILQLPEDSSFDQIKQRYRHLSKMVHPDKHPIQNYQIAQAHFNQIDEAYKAISSQLRRYVFKHYGAEGISLVENNPFYFQEYEKADLLDPLVLRKLNQFILYCLYQEHANNQIDKNAVRTKTILLVNKPINNVNAFPQVQREQFSFETSLPDFLGMSNSIEIAHASESLSSQAKSVMIYGITSSRRINQNLMLNLQASMHGNVASFQAGFDRTIDNNVVLHFVPIIIQDGQLQAAQIGADLHRDNYYVSGVTDLSSFTVLVGSEPGNKTKSTVLKFGFEDNGFVVSPIFERDVTQSLRLFAHLQFRINNQGNTSQFSFGLQYGYKLKLLEQMRLQLTSYFGYPQSHFQISIITPKFKGSLPIFVRGGDPPVFQMYKLGMFVGVYLSYELYNYYSKRTEKNRRLLEFQNYNRISVEKSAVAKNNSDYSNVAEESKANQKKHSGLIVLAAYIGSDTSIKRVKNKILHTFDLKKKHPNLEQTLQKAERLKEQIKTNEDDHKNQLYEISQSIQARIKGSQLLSYRVDEIGVNPCLDQKQNYGSLTLCWLKQSLVLVTKGSSKPIVVGGLQKHYQKPWYHSLKDYFLEKVVN